MTESTLTELEKLFLALSDRTRLRLLTLMADGETSVGYLADTLGESQPKISRHLAYLRTAGLVSTRRDGKWVYYGIADQEDEAVARVLDVTLRPNAAGSEIQADSQNRQNDGDAYRPDVNEPDISAETYIGDWKPNEIEIFLL